jgi:hypothetical protein
MVPEPPGTGLSIGNNDAEANEAPDAMPLTSQPLHFTVTRDSHTALHTKRKRGSDHDLTKPNNYKETRKGDLY